MNYIDGEYESMIEKTYPHPISDAMILNAEFNYRELDYKVKDILIHPKVYADMMMDDLMIRSGVYYTVNFNVICGFNFIVTPDIEGFRLLLSPIR